MWKESPGLSGLADKADTIPAVKIIPFYRLNLDSNGVWYSSFWSFVPRGFEAQQTWGFEAQQEGCRGAAGGVKGVARGVFEGQQDGTSMQGTTDRIPQ